MSPSAPRRSAPPRAVLTSPSAPSPIPLRKRSLSVAARLLVVLIGAYRRFLSPLLGPHCRYHPTCSVYALEAIETHGALRGGALAVRRIARCHPWAAGGVDPVPPVNRRSRKRSPSVKRRVA